MTPTSGDEPASAARPCSAAACTTSIQIAPAFTRAIRASGSMLTPFSLCIFTSTVPERSPSAGALSPVPCAVIWNPASPTQWTISITSWTFSGTATAAGRWSTARCHARRASSQFESPGRTSSPTRLARTSRTCGARTSASCITLSIASASCEVFGRKDLALANAAANRPHSRFGSLVATLPPSSSRTTVSVLFRLLLGLARAELVDHRRVRERRHVAERPVLRHVAEQAPHDLAAAGLRQLGRENDVRRLGDRADLDGDVVAKL